MGKEVRGGTLARYSALALLRPAIEMRPSLVMYLRREGHHQTVERTTVDLAVLDVESLSHGDDARPGSAANGNALRARTHLWACRVKGFLGDITTHGCSAVQAVRGRTRDF